MQRKFIWSLPRKEEENEKVKSSGNANLFAISRDAACLRGFKEDSKVVKNDALSSMGNAFIKRSDRKNEASAKKIYLVFALQGGGKPKG